MPGEAGDREAKWIPPPPALTASTVDRGWPCWRVPRGLRRPFGSSVPRRALGNSHLCQVPLFPSSPPSPEQRRAWTLCSFFVLYRFLLHILPAVIVSTLYFLRSYHYSVVIYLLHSFLLAFLSSTVFLFLSLLPFLDSSFKLFIIYCFFSVSFLRSLVLYSFVLH